MRLLVLFLLAFVGCGDSVLPPWKNYTLPIPVRVKNLLSVLKIEEKFPQLSSNAPAIPRLGIKQFKWGNEALHGIVNHNGYATIFPQPIGTAASWDKELVRKIATAVSDEARGMNNNQSDWYGLTVWAPNANLFTHARWGRGHETYGESVHLAIELNTQYILGLQQGEYPTQQKYLKLVSTPKHFLAYQLEEADGYTRFYFNANVSQRDLVDTYLPVWEASVKKANAEGVMCSYNSVNGVPNCASKKWLTQWLRDEHKFSGYVTSDCGAVEGIWHSHRYIKDPQVAAAQALKAGTDLDCGSAYKKYLNATAIKAGLLTEQDVDSALGRLLTLRFKLGEFDPDHMVPWKQIPPSVVNSAKHRQLARQASRESIVLLDNKKKLLPFDTKKIKRIAVVGPSANDTFVLLGNYHGQTDKIVTPFAGIQQRAKQEGIEVQWAQGVAEIGDGLWLQQKAVAVADWADIVVVCVGLSARKTPGSCYDPKNKYCVFPAQEKEALDRTVLTLPHEQSDFVKGLKMRTKTPVVGVFINGGPIAIDWELEHLDGSVLGWYGGEEMGSGLADVLFGDYDPAGRLPWTMYSANYVNKIAATAMTMNVGVGRTYRYLDLEMSPPRLAFGYGQSYAAWHVLNMKVTPESGPSSVARTVTVTVKREQGNAGTTPAVGDFVVSLWLETGEVPAKLWGNTKLAAFTKVKGVKTGETQTATLTIEPESLHYTDSEGNRVSTPGQYVVACDGIGGASSSVTLTIT